MKQLCILPCGKKKIWDKDPNIGKTKAKLAYIGVLHQLCRKYSDIYFDDWLIISAKHGLLLAEDEVPKNYDLSFDSKNSNVISVERLKEQIIEKDLSTFHDIVVLTGKKYQPFIDQAFMHAKRIQYPLLGTRGIGDMQRLLKESIASQKPLHETEEE